MPPRHPREALEPLVVEAGESSSAPSIRRRGLEMVSDTLMAPFTSRKSRSSQIFADLAPVIMTPRMIHAATTQPRARQPLEVSRTSGKLDFATLGRAPMRIAMTRRITSLDLAITEATPELLREDVPEPHVNDVASDFSLLRGFKATVPSSEKGKTRRRQLRAVDAPHMGLRKLGLSARGLITDDVHEDDTTSNISEEDVVVVGNTKRRRKPRGSLTANKVFGKAELQRQREEILLDKENLHVRRSLVTSEINEITRKIDTLAALRSQLEQDLLRIHEEDLELDAELEGVQERSAYEEANRVPEANTHHVAQASRRRKGPAFLPSEHDELPPGVAFMTLRGHDSAISCLDISEPYGTLVSASSGPDDSDPRVWDLLTGEEIGRLRGHSGPVKCLQVEEHVALTGGNEGTVRIWDLRRLEEDDLQPVPEEGQALSGPCERIMEGHTKAVTSLYFEDDCLVTGASDKTIRQWDLSTGQCVMTMDILWAIAHPPSNSNLAPNNIFAAAGSSFSVPMPPYADGSWDMYTDFVGGVQFWGHALVSGSGDGVVRLWDMRTGQAHRTLVGHTAPVTCLQFDELHIVSGGLDKTIRIWDLRTGGIFETNKYEHAITSLQFDSRKIVAATGENGIKIYNRTTMQHSTLATGGHTAPVERLRFMDRYLVSGGKDSTIKIWAL